MRSVPGITLDTVTMHNTTHNQISSHVACHPLEYSVLMRCNTKPVFSDPASLFNCLPDKQAGATTKEQVIK